MSFLQTEFNKFHEAIKLNDLKDNQPLREKRDMLVKELEVWGKNNDKPEFKRINQGSYDFGTGVIPLGSDDYDIDVGIIYDLDVDEYDSVEVKKWIRDALSGYNRKITIKFPCVRVQYYKAGELAYHVDFAVYGKKYNLLNFFKHLCLARGKEFSTEDYKYWEEAEPEKLKKILNGRFTDTEDRYQFKRCIRYLKRWKDKNFTTNGTARPNGIAMTACGYHWFQPETENWNGEKNIEDLTALVNLVGCIRSNNYGLDVTLPVLPGNLLFEALRANNAHEQDYIKKMDKLYKALLEAKEEADPHDAAKKLKKVFGEDFPVPPKKSTARGTRAPAIVPSTESA